MRVVIDTNVWVSRLLVADSMPARAVDAALASSEVIVSEPLVDHDLLTVNPWRGIEIIPPRAFLETT